MDETAFLAVGSQLARAPLGKSRQFPSLTDPVSQVASSTRSSLKRLLYAGREATEEFGLVHDESIWKKWGPKLSIGTLKA